MTKTPVAATTPEEKLDVIIGYLDAMNRRDKLRTTGAFIRGLLGLIPLAVFIWSIWFFAGNYQQIMGEITKSAATAAAEATKNGSKGMLDDLMKQYDFPGNSGSSSSAHR